MNTGKPSSRCGIFYLILGMLIFGLIACAPTASNLVSPESETETTSVAPADLPTEIIITPSISPTPVSPTATYTSIPSPTPTKTPTPTRTYPPAPSQTSTETQVPPTPSADQAINIYAIQLDTGGPVACGDTLVRLNTGAWRTGDIKADVASALKRLFSKQKNYGALFNPVYLSNFKLVSVDYKQYTGAVTIQLSGTYVRSGDRCDDGRVRAQVWTTIRQFPEVKEIFIYLNGNKLGDILATRFQK